MATKHTCKQGDSFEYDFSSTGVDSFLTDWTGKWALVVALGDTPTASGTLLSSVDGNKMELRILPAETEVIALGSYILVVELTNAAIGFNREVMQDTFTVKAQGIPA